MAKSTKSAKKTAKKKTTSAKRTTSTAAPAKTKREKKATTQTNGNGRQPRKTYKRAVTGGPATKAIAVTKAAEEVDFLEVKGAREHNLKNVTLRIPKKKMSVFTGVSGSGKTSMAFDTIFAEGQRRYVESLSAYARQFLGQMEKPHYESIRGLSPTISIEQKAASKNPRSTVGTVTEIHDYLRVLYARVGVQYCHICGEKVGRGDAQTMVGEILQAPAGTKILLLAPIVEARKGEHRDIIAGLMAQGFVRARVDGVVTELAGVQSLAKNKKHTIEVVVDRLAIKHDDPIFRKRLTDSVEATLKTGQGILLVHRLDEERDQRMSEHRSHCGHSFPALEPQIFSFNSPLGACKTCDGLGTTMEVDIDRIVPDPTKSIQDGAVAPWANFMDGSAESWNGTIIQALVNTFGLDTDRPWKKLPKKMHDLVLYGSGDKEMTVRWERKRGSGEWRSKYEGVIPAIKRRHRQTHSEMMKEHYLQFYTQKPCPDCHGSRLRPEARAVKVGDINIQEFTKLTIGDAYNYVSNLELAGNEKLIGEELLKEIRARLGFLVNVGLDYLTLDRSAPTLSGGEAQRIRLASQIGSELTGVLYILDEPSIGLHQRDNLRLLGTLKHLRDIGNTVIVVEHDQETIEEADHVVDFGPAAGHLGGDIVFSGSPAKLKKDKKSITGAYLAGREKIAIPETRLVPGGNEACDYSHGEWITVKGARANNLRGVDAQFPLGLLTCVTGVSGAGKSSLINQILYPALSRLLHKSSVDVGEHDRIEGLKAIDKVIDIDQQPIGRTPRSNPATYTKAYDPIRNFFSLLPESKTRGYKPGRFSFNVKGGRCEACEGKGYVLVPMHFLADVWVPCEVCHTKRFNDATLQVTYRGHSIADVLELSVLQARDLFQDHPKIHRILDTMIDVGLGYIHVGQSATTLSGGEAQRLKLSRELAKRDTGRTLYILDEPTTGLHFHDIRKLLEVLQRLVDQGNTVIVIEHNLDVIKTADWIVDMGPEGGSAGGEIIALGPPEEVAQVKASYTGQFLATML